MPFKVGHKRTGGRKKGTPNKNRPDLIRELEARNFNVLDEILKILPSLDAAMKIRSLLNLMEYIYPRKRAITIDEEETQAIQAKIVEKIEDLRSLPKDSKRALLAQLQKALEDGDGDVNEE